MVEQAIDCLIPPVDPREFYGSLTKDSIAARKVSDIPMALTLRKEQILKSIKVCSFADDQIPAPSIVGLQAFYGDVDSSNLDVHLQSPLFPVGLVMDNATWDDNQVLRAKEIIDADLFPD